MVEGEPEYQFYNESYWKVIHIMYVVDTFGIQKSALYSFNTQPSKLADIVSRYQFATAARKERLKKVRYDRPEVRKQIAALWEHPEDGWDHIYALVDQMEREAAANISPRLNQKSLRFHSIALVFVLLFLVSLSLSSYIF